MLGVYDKGKAGTVVETETVLAEKGGARYVRIVGSAFYVGQGGWGGPKGRLFPLLFGRWMKGQREEMGSGADWCIGPSTVNYPPPKDKKPDATYAYQTTTESAHLYRCVLSPSPSPSLPIPTPPPSY